MLAVWICWSLRQKHTKCYDSALKRVVLDTIDFAEHPRLQSRLQQRNIHIDSMDVTQFGQPLEWRSGVVFGKAPHCSENSTPIPQSL